MNEDFLNSFLSEAEKDALTQVANSELAMMALEKVILADVYFKGTLRKKVAPDATRNAAFALAFSQTALSNEILGADIRAQAEGVRLVEVGFGRLKKFKSEKQEKQPKGNPAR